MKEDLLLIEALQNSDRKAFEQLYDRYVRIVYSFLVSTLQDSHLAEDLTQWCFMQLWERRNEILTDGNLPAWLYVVARNAAYKEIRRKLTAARYVEYAANAGDQFDTVPTSSSEIKVITDEMSSVINDFPESRKKIFLMRTVDGLSVNEIAQILGISPKTVETQISRAKASLRKKASELLFLAIVTAFGI